MAQRILRMIKEHPPRQPLTSLEAVVEDWSWRFAPGSGNEHLRDGVVAITAQQETLIDAIRVAIACRDATGKFHNHQSRVAKVSLEAFEKTITKAIPQINKIVELSDRFDRLHDLLESIRPIGIGEVTTYDIATRIAAYLDRKHGGFEVQSLYLHAGVRQGWQALYGRKGKPPRRISRGDLPEELQKITTDEVEDMLCCYRDIFLKWKLKEICG